MAVRKKRRKVPKDRTEALIEINLELLERVGSLEHVIECMLATTLLNRFEGEGFLEMIKQTSRDSPLHHKVLKILDQAKAFAVSFAPTTTMQ